jgi:hypothetical protein
LWFLSRLPLCLKVPHVLLTLNPTVRCMFTRKELCHTNFVMSAFEIICYFIVTCVHFNKSYVWACNLLW